MASIEQEVNVKFTDDRIKFVVNMIHTVAWIKNKHTKALEPFDISIPQHNILRILRGAGDWLAMSVVKDRMVETAPNTTRLADKLVTKGLIDRQRSEADRRVVYVKITKAGLELLKRTDALDEYSILDPLDPELAGKMSDMLDEMRK